MTNSKKTPTLKTPQKKALPNSLRLKHPIQNWQGLSNILGRLPFLQELNEAQEQILAITPVWQKWCDQELASGQLSQYAALASLSDGRLTILCKQAIIATILKNQQTSLLDAIQIAGFKHVKSVRVQMSLQPNIENESQQNAGHSNNHLHKDLKPDPVQPETSHSRPSASALKSIEAAQSLIKNEQLAASFKRLTETLKKIT